MNVKITARKFKAHSTLKDFINSEIDSLNKFNSDVKSEKYPAVNESF